MSDQVFAADCLGSAEEVSHEQICNDEDDELILIKGSKAHTSASIILRGPNDSACDVLEQAIHDSLCVVKCVLESKKLVVGEGRRERQGYNRAKKPRNHGATDIKSGEIVMVAVAAKTVKTNAPDSSFIVEFSNGARVCINANNIRRLTTEEEAQKQLLVDSPDDDGKLDRFQGPHCPSHYAYKRGLKEHLEIAHEANIKVKCDVCPKIFNNKHALRARINNVHGKKRLECSLCGQKYKQPTACAAPIRLFFPSMEIRQPTSHGNKVAARLWYFHGSCFM